MTYEQAIILNVIFGATVIGAIVVLLSVGIWHDRRHTAHLAQVRHLQRRVVDRLAA